MNRIVRNPDVFTDCFEHTVENTRPVCWLENNQTHYWTAQKNKDGGMMYGCASKEVFSATWLHVFETNVDVTAKIKAEPGINAQIALVARLCSAQACIRAGYDFEQHKWYLEDQMGADFDARMFWAEKGTDFLAGTWHEVRLRLVDTCAQIYCDGELMLDVQEINHVTTGRVGVITCNAAVWMDAFSLSLLSGQGRVEKAPMANYVISFAEFAEGGSIFWYSDELAIANYMSILYLSLDQGQTFRKATDEETKKYAFFAQSDRTQYIRLHSGNILKIDNYTGGRAYLSTDNGMTAKQVGMLWDEEKLEKNWRFYGGMNDMLKEVRLRDGRYRVFYCADVRAYGNPEGQGRIDHHWEEVYYTDDEGATWHKSRMDTRLISALNHVCESRILACDDGTLRMYCSWNDSNCFRYFVSYDDGETWQGEYALPQMRIPRGSHCLIADPTQPGTNYAVFVYCEPNKWKDPQNRTRLALARTTDGKNWEYLMDCWRWDEGNNKRPGKPPINQIVDPSIAVTRDYVFIASGWSEQDMAGYHQKQQQHVLKLRKADLTPYEVWPTYIPRPDEVCWIEAIAPQKAEYLRGETLDLTGGWIIVHYYDGSMGRVRMDDPAVSICEPDLSVNYTTCFSGPEMNRPGHKVLRADYKHFAANFTIFVK